MACYSYFNEFIENLTDRNKLQIIIDIISIVIKSRDQFER